MNVQSETLDYKLSKRWGVGDKLLISAWLVEIVAATIGLLIAGTVILQASDSALWTVTIMASLPFIMVAVVELCKIPIATAAYHTRSKFWRGVFVFGLFFLMFITFETMGNGFEWGFSLRTSEITAQRKKLSSMDETLENKNAELVTLNALTNDQIQNEYAQATNEINKNRDAQLNILSGQMSDLNKLSEKGGVVQLDRELKQKQNELTKLSARRNSELATANSTGSSKSAASEKRLASQQKRYEERIAELDQKLEDLSKREEAALEKCFICEDDKQRFAALRAPLAKDREELSAKLSAMAIGSSLAEIDKNNAAAVNSINQKYDRQAQQLQKRIQVINSELLKRRTTSTKALKPQLDGLRSRQNQVSKSYGAQLKAAAERRDLRLSELKEKGEKATLLTQVITSDNEQRVVIRDKINELAEGSQIYRLTALMYGEDSPADVTNDQLKTISIIWFGSLAAITAWTGTLLAFGGLVVKYGPHKRHDEPRRRRGTIRHAFRSLLIDFRKRARKPKIVEVQNEVVKTVEVVKEVPVDKVVFKEVPKEVIKKEMVYVPFFTNETELLNLNNGPGSIDEMQADAKKAAE